MNLAELEAKPHQELMEMARQLGISDYEELEKSELVLRLLQVQAEQQGLSFATGTLEIMGEGYGFLRLNGLIPKSSDIYVSPAQIRRLGLRPGDTVSGEVRPPREAEKYSSLLRVEAVFHLDPEQSRNRPHFNALTPIFPNRLINLETTSTNLSNRLLNLIAPIGRGQRGLIVSPPKAGKTMLLKNIANGITANHPDIHLMVLLIGERPEEVTDMKRSVKAEVVAATFDEPVEVQTRVAELALERTKRLVELGKDVVILLDGITRLTRAYNLALPPSGRTLSGGIDSVALHPAKRFFGAARNIEEGGSLTIIGTCLIDTGSRMDELIYEEFKGTGNMEVHLDRRLAEKRVFPAMDIVRSGTRREDLLLDELTLKQVWLLRRMVSLIAADSNTPTEATERVLERLARTASNSDFLSTLTKDI